MARGHARRARDKFELLTRWGDVFGSLSLSAHDPVEVPAVGDALKLVLARVLEREARSCCQVLHGLSRQNLRRTGHRCDTGPDDNRDPSRLARDGRNLPRM